MGCAPSSEVPKACISKVDPGVLASIRPASKGRVFGAAAMLADPINNALYLAGGAGLAVMDISDPRSTKIVGAVIDTGVLTHDAGAALLRWGTAGNLLYVVGGNGLAVMDIWDVWKPSRLGDVISIGALSPNGAIAAAMSSCGGYLYLAGSQGLAIMDLSNPRKPKFIGIPMTSGAISSAGGVALAVSENDALYVAGGRGLAVLDLADPGRPSQVELLEMRTLTLESDVSIAIRDQRLFVVGHRGLAVFDLDEPLKPMCVGDMAFGTAGSVAMAFAESTVVIAGGMGLALFRPSATGAQCLGGVADTGCLSEDGACGLCVQKSPDGDFIVFVAGGKGLGVFDGTQLGIPEEIALAIHELSKHMPNPNPT